MTTEGGERFLGAPRFDVVLRGYDRRQVDEHLARLQRVIGRLRADLEIARGQQAMPPTTPGRGFRPPTTPGRGFRPQPEQPRQPAPPRPAPGADVVGGFTDRMQSILRAAEEEAAEIRRKARAEAAGDERLRAQVAELVNQRDSMLAELNRVRGRAGDAPSADPAQAGAAPAPAPAAGPGPPAPHPGPSPRPRPSPAPRHAGIQPAPASTGAQPVPNRTGAQPVAGGPGGQPLPGTPAPQMRPAAQVDGGTPTRGTGDRLDEARGADEPGNTHAGESGAVEAGSVPGALFRSRPSPAAAEPGQAERTVAVSPVRPRPSPHPAAELADEPAEATGAEQTVAVGAVTPTGDEAEGPDGRDGADTDGAGGESTVVTSAVRPSAERDADGSTDPNEANGSGHHTTNGASRPTSAFRSG